MSAALPEPVDAWRAVVARRRYRGSVPLSRLARLAGLLADVAGSIEYDLQFGRDAYGCAFLEVEGSGGLPLVCQRTLEVFVLPVAVRQRLGLIRDEGEAVGLPREYEALLVGDGDRVDPLAALEDELILAIPVVPVAPGAVERDGEVPLSRYASADVDPDAADYRPGPFAVLSRLKKER